MTGTLNSGGAERMMVNLSSGLTKKGLDVNYFLVNATGPYLKEVLDEVHIVDLNAGFGVKSIPFTLRKKLNHIRPDILITTQPHINSMVNVYTIGLKKKPLMIIREANTPSHDYKDAGKFQKWGYRMGYRLADHFVAVSEGVKSDMAGFYDINPDMITTIYNPVVDASIEQKSQEPVSHPWFEGNIPMIVAMGRVVPQKDHLTLIKAVARVNHVQKVRLMIMGEKDQAPEYRKEVEQTISKHNLQDQVELSGFVRNPFSRIARADLFVLSSSYEGLPGSLIQALACGCPVISTECPSGPAEILDHGKYGTLVPVGDAEQMGDAILNTLSRNHNKERLKERAKEFSVERATDYYLELMEQLIEQKKF